MAKKTTKKSTKKDKKSVGILCQWHIVAKELQKFLGADPEVTATIDTEEMSIDIITGNPIKAAALFDLLRNKPMEWEDGSLLKFKVNGDTKTYETTCEDKDFERAFRDNPYFSHVDRSSDDSYVMWNAIPVQVAVNNLQDPNGFEHIMPTDLAQIVFQPLFAYGTEPLKMCFFAN